MADEQPKNQPTAKARRAAAAHNENGLQHYGDWEMAEAVAAFKEAIDHDGDNPEYHLNLARAYARSGDYHEAMTSLGDYLRTETDDNVAARYERLFSSALDDVEELFIARMRELEMPLEQIGKAMQMWLEYRITVGRRPLNIPRPALWAGALTYAVAKINMDELSVSQIAAAYDISEKGLREKYRELVQTLDLMPADFRYFTGDDNPLDKLVEAAQLLDEMYGRFREE